MIAISPSSVKETYDLAIRCFNLSEKYRTPVIFLLDEIIGHMVRLDLLSGSRPFNPMINAGAIAVADCIDGSNTGDRIRVCLDYARRLTGNPFLAIDEDVLRSEKSTGYKNRAIVNLLKSSGIIEGEAPDVLELYFSMCSVSVNCRDLAYLAAVLAGGGKDPLSREQLIAPGIVKLVRSLMVTCNGLSAAEVIIQGRRQSAQSERCLCDAFRSSKNRCRYGSDEAR